MYKQLELMAPVLKNGSSIFLIDWDSTHNQPLYKQLIIIDGKCITIICKNANPTTSMCNEVVRAYKKNKE